MAEVRVGISGWRYEPWRGAFYPADLHPSTDRLTQFAPDGAQRA